MGILNRSNYVSTVKVRSVSREPNGVSYRTHGKHFEIEGVQEIERSLQGP
jgi:hypothetical protein